MTDVVITKANTLGTRALPHRLIIESLQDLEATCSCGNWRHTYIPVVPETAAELTARAEQWHAGHVALRSLRWVGKPRFAVLSADSVDTSAFE